MSKLLSRQLKKQGLSEEALPQDIDAWNAFLKSIANTYKLADEDRYLLERSLELSSKEMRAEIDRNKQMSLQLAQAGKLASLGTMASGIAHELNNPLAGIKGYAQLMSLSENLSDEDQKGLESIVKLSDRMAGIIKHLLKLSRQNSKSGEKVEIDAREPLNDILELLHRQFITDDIELKISENTDSCKIFGNANALSSVFQNLITNSRDAFLEKSELSSLEININFSDDGESLVIKYQDTAGGMDEETLEKIFDPFYSTKEVGKGTGLGMAITKQVIEELDGSIVATSRAGVGSQFEIRFPLAKKPEKSVTSIGGANITDWQTTPTQRHSVLVIDDEEVICRLVKKMLDECFVVETVTTPEQGVQRFQEKAFDLVLTDLRMPKMDGTQVATEIRKARPEIPLVFMSGHIDGDTGGELNPFHPYVLLEKPLPNPRKFVEILTSQIEGTPLKMEAV